MQRLQLDPSSLASLFLPLVFAVQPGPEPVRPIAGEAVILPVESNLSTKPWVRVQASSGEGSAPAAVDGDAATVWRPATGAPGEWLRIDLGGAYDNLRKVEVVFARAGEHRYALEVSADGESWARIAEVGDRGRPSRGGVHLFTRPGTRQVRVLLLGVDTAAGPGIAELRIFNYLRDDLVLGADLSFMDDLAERTFYVHPGASGPARGAGPHLLDVVEDRGVEFVRLRIFNDPRNERTGERREPPRQGPERSLASAREVKARGLGLGIDFHYADSWADPGKQPKPRAWAELPFDSLVTAVHEFTHGYLRELVEQGTPPQKVAIGNEIINGFLWGSESHAISTAAGAEESVNPPYFRDQAEIYQSRPGGRILWQYWGAEEPEKRRQYREAWDRFATLVAAGIRAVREASPGSRVELHTIVGSGEGERSGLDKTMEFWTQLLGRLTAAGQSPDVMAVSYYPEWHGTVEQLDVNLHTIATAHPQFDVNIAETAYPAAGETPQPNAVYPRTVQGQADAIQRVFQAANDVVDNRGVGVLLWEPASFQSMFRPVSGSNDVYEPLASIDVFNRSHARHVLQDRVYTATRAGNSPDLPGSVAVLTTADGSISEAEVRWDPAPEERWGTVGEVVVEGATDYGRVLAIVDVMPTEGAPTLSP